MTEEAIAIVGLGMTGLEQVTAEVDRVLRRSREVLFVDPAVGTRAFLEARCAKVTPLYGRYLEGGRRLSAYRQMAAAVIEAALDHPPVCFAVPGHPLVFVYAPRLIRDAAAALDLPVRVYPGISATDCLYAELGLDPGARGVLQYEATDMLLRRRPLLPDLPLILWQVGSVETRLHTRRPSRPERFDRLVRYLRQAYPADHPVTALHVSTHPLAPSVRLELPLEGLGERATALHAGVTLYLPPVRERPIQDLDLLARVDDPAHLRRITRDP